MKTTILLLFISCFTFSSNSREAAPFPSARVDQIVADWERAKAYTKEYLDAVSEESINFKPTPEMRSFAEQMLHLTMGNQGIVALSAGKEPLFKQNIEKMDQYKTKEALTKVVMEGYDFVIGIVKSMDDLKLEEKVKFFNRQEYSRAMGIAKAFEHQTHHRGQATVYLRLKGLTPPAEKLF
ncbi:hypothetical protein BH09BAC3_BH09BAC3_01870 [soil metagenome]